MIYNCIISTLLCNLDPLTTHFYIENLGCREVYIIFLIFSLKHRLWVLVRLWIHDSVCIVAIRWVNFRQNCQLEHELQCSDYNV